MLTPASSTTASCRADQCLNEGGVAFSAADLPTRPYAPSWAGAATAAEEGARGQQETAPTFLDPCVPNLQQHQHLDTQGFVPTSTIVTVPAREIKSQNQDGACRHWRARAPRLDGFCRWDWPTRAGRDLAPRRASTGCVALAASLRYAQPVVAASVLTRSLGEPLSETWAVQASASRTARSRGPCARQTLSFPPSATTTVACRTAWSISSSWGHSAILRAVSWTSSPTCASARAPTLGNLLCGLGSPTAGAVGHGRVSSECGSASRSRQCVICTFCLTQDRSRPYGVQRGHCWPSRAEATPPSSARPRLQSHAHGRAGVFGDGSQNKGYVL